MEVTSMQTRILLTGASGLLGSKIVQMSRERNLTIYPTYNEHPAQGENKLKVDLQNPQQINDSLQSLKPEYVIHCAALTDVDKCEINQELAQKINIEGTRNIIKASEKAGAFLIFVSTDYVFQGDKGAYKEEDETNPINYYGYTKLQAEILVRNMMSNWAIVRPSVIYGSVPAAGKVNFALWLINKLQQREPVKIITDQWVSPTLNTNLGEMILEIIQRRLSGVYHLAGATQINRYEFSKKIAQCFSLDEKLILPALSKDMNWLAKRPLNTTLNTQKASHTLGAKPMVIQEALTQLKTEIDSKVDDE